MLLPVSFVQVSWNLCGMKRKSIFLKLLLTGFGCQNSCPKENKKTSKENNCYACFSHRKKNCWEVRKQENHLVSDLVFYSQSTISYIRAKRKDSPAYTGFFVYLHMKCPPSIICLTNPTSSNQWFGAVCCAPYIHGSFKFCLLLKWSQNRWTILTPWAWWFQDPLQEGCVLLGNGPSQLMPQMSITKQSMHSTLRSSSWLG